MEPENSMFYICAAYFSMYCQIKTGQVDPVKSQANSLVVRQLIYTHASQQLQVSISAEKSHKGYPSSSVTYTKGLEKQKQAAFDILYDIYESLEIIFGRSNIQPEDFSELVGNNKEKAKILFDLLLGNGILERQTVAGE